MNDSLTHQDESGMFQKENSFLPVVFVWRTRISKLLVLVTENRIVKQDKALKLLMKLAQGKVTQIHLIAFADCSRNAVI